MLTFAPPDSQRKVGRCARGLDQRFQVLHALVVTLLQLVLVSLLVLLNELAVPLQGITTFLKQLFETQPELILMLRGNLPIKQIPAR